MSRRVNAWTQQPQPAPRDLASRRDRILHLADQVDTIMSGESEQALHNITQLYRSVADLTPEERFLGLWAWRLNTDAHGLRNLLSAAALIGRGHPDDAGAITRRTLEAARTAYAIKYDPTNFEEWAAEEQREARRAARLKGEPPPRLRIDIKLPKAHRLLESMGREIGMLSDIAVHFTPDFADRQHWQHETEGGATTVLLPHHCPDGMEIRQQLILLAGFHEKVLALFNECFDNALGLDAELRRQYEEARGVLQELSRQFLRERQAQRSHEDPQQ